MRIVSGRYRGRTITPPKNFSARPTTDFAKEALFNIISVNFDVEEAAALDLFSGTGGISFEFASRGCRSVDSVEMNFAHHAFIKKTAQELQFSQMRCYKQNAFSFLATCKNTYDIIFADPPYDLEGIEKIHEAVFSRQLLNPGGWLILEHSKSKDFSTLAHFKEHRNYGSVNFSIFAS
ncbi:MAG: 16S rRNA (guanine(966)-N(2))-methyltransferase RsmD [Prevotellaceae bacterium]|jgi:16S rRNA (guanine(966)-N(2))-methyltransferase RsmD|nr:16S rRNA (guanine(966)-N(2))-methyltransferase RsmD [Prevotellaceae bacterium]